MERFEDEDDGSGTGFFSDNGSDDDKSMEIDLSGDGGVLKKLIKKGRYGKVPSPTCEVHVNYKGYLLNGTEFDSNGERDEGRPMVFRLGQGHVIKGWEIGLLSMKKGEISTFTCAPAYAFGEGGSKKEPIEFTRVPPNSTVQFEIELTDWVEEIDITERKDRGVMKKTIREGKGWQRPKEDSTVTVKIVGYRGDNSEFERKASKSFDIGTEAVVVGLQLGVMTMKQNEKAIFTISNRYAYGQAGEPSLGILKNESIRYEVELLDFTKEKENWQMSKKERLETGLKKKNEGNAFYGDQNFELAEKKYKQALSLFEFEQMPTSEEASLKLTCLLNISACLVKSSKFIEAKTYCEKALEMEPNNVKGLFRRGKCLAELGDFAEAEADFKKVVEIDPKDPAARKELALLSKKKADEDKEEKKRYAGMFEKMAKEEVVELKQPERHILVQSAINFIFTIENYSKWLIIFLILLFADLYMFFVQQSPFDWRIFPLGGLVAVWTFVLYWYPGSDLTKKKNN